MSESLYLITLGVFFGTILLVFGMRSLSAYWQAKARLDGGEAYRQIQEALEDIRTRLASVEKILKDVE
jgi:hypothetical protein